MSNEKDKHTANGIAYRYLDSTNSSRKLETEIVAALTTARKEAREEAFKEAKRIAGDFKRLDADTLWLQYKTTSVVEALEAAAPTPSQPAREAWSEWFERLGDRATAEVVNATANLVTNERLAALSQAGVLPALPAAAETVGERCGHGVVIGSACHYCPNTVAAKGESKEVNNARNNQ